METIYDVDYFINKCQSIPIDKWNIGSYINIEDSSMKCILGHCGQIVSSHRFTDEAKALEEILSVLTITHRFKFPVVFKAPIINDKEAMEYQQETPQERILAALYDVKKFQQSQKSETIVIEKIKYVSVSEIIKNEISLIAN